MTDENGPKNVSWLALPFLILVDHFCFCLVLFLSLSYCVFCFFLGGVAVVMVLDVGSSLSNGMGDRASTWDNQHGIAAKKFEDLEFFTTHEANRPNNKPR